MNLPPEIESLVGPPPPGETRIVVLSSSDWEGNPGETYLAADSSNLFLVHPRPGEPCRCVRLALREVEDLSLVPDGLYTNLEIAGGSPRATLRFPSWDRSELNRVIECWQRASGRTSRRGGTDDPGALGASGRIGSTIAASPRLIFAASLHAMAEADGDSAEAERAEIIRILGDATALEEGISLFRQNGLENLLASLRSLLNAAQQRCLVANLLGVAMADGLLRGAEQTLLDRFQQALAMSDAEFQPLRDVLLAQHNLAVFAPGPTPAAARAEPQGLTIFCAAVLALIEVDGVTADEEREALPRLLDDPSAWEAGRAILAESGIEGVLASLDGLNRAQQRCLLGNLVAMGMCDGWLRTSEQELIERFRRAMSFGVEEYDAIFQVLLSKDDLSVFA